MKHEKYDRIGIGYNDTRQADPYLVSKFLEHLDTKPGQKILDIGCGTGNYTSALRQSGMNCIGMDPSGRMLSSARKNHPDDIWLKGSAEQTKLDAESIDAIVGSLTIHHWQNLEKAFHELNRVLRPEGKLVLFTSTPEQMKRYWLNAYFPKMLQDSMDQMPDLATVTKALHASKFESITTQKYFVTKDLEDLFLYGGKHRPHLYLDVQVRQGISSFSDLSNAKEVDTGLAQLALDIKSNKIQDEIDRYENDLGDYLFVIAQKA